MRSEPARTRLHHWRQGSAHQQGPRGAHSCRSCSCCCCGACPSAPAMAAFVVSDATRLLPRDCCHAIECVRRALLPRAAVVWWLGPDAAFAYPRADERVKMRSTLARSALWRSRTRRGAVPKGRIEHELARRGGRQAQLFTRPGVCGAARRRTPADAVALRLHRRRKRSLIGSASASARSAMVVAVCERPSPARCAIRDDRTPLPTHRRGLSSADGKWRPATVQVQCSVSFWMWATTATSRCASA